MPDVLQFLGSPSYVPGIEVRILVAVAFTTAAAYFDIFNRKWVPNLLLYAFAACAFLVNVAFFEQAIFAQALVFGAAAFLVSYPLYRAGQLGGADMFCYSSIAMAIPYLPEPLLSPDASAPYPFILSVLIPTGIAFIAHMFIRFVPLISSQLSRGKIRFTAAKLAPAAMLALAFLIFVIVLLSMPVKFPPGLLRPARIPLRGAYVLHRLQGHDKGQHGRNGPGIEA